MKEIFGILLAAGSSKRFGSHKLLQPLPSGVLLGMAAARNLITAIPHSLAVIRPGDQTLAAGFTALGLEVIENPHANDGMGSSLAMAVTAAGDAAGWVIALADMPWIQPQTTGSLAHELRRGASLVAPVHQGRRGHPVGFHRKWRSQLQALSGGQGARDLLIEHCAELTLQQTDDTGVLLDVDQPVDLHRK